MLLARLTERAERVQERLVEAGEPLTYIQQQLGHHSPAFTLAVYGHLLPRGDRRAVDRLDNPIPEVTIRNPPATYEPGEKTHGSDFEPLGLAVSDLTL